MKPSILCVGNANISIHYGIPKPKMCGNMNADTFQMLPSGFAVTCALAVNALGGEGYPCCKIGNDFFGNRIKQCIQSAGSQTRFVYQDKELSTGSVCNLGDDVSVCYSGANLSLSEDDIENAMLSYPDAVVVDMKAGDEIAYCAVTNAMKYKLCTICSFSDLKAIDMDTANDFDYIKNCDIIVVDSVSAHTLTGVSPSSPDLCVKVCLDIIYRFSSKYVVLRLDERGSLSYDGKHCEFYPGIDSSEAFGDISKISFIASFSLDYVRNNNVGHACRAANIVSAYAEMHTSDITNLPTADQINKYVKEQELKI